MRGSEVAGPWRRAVELEDATRSPARFARLAGAGPRGAFELDCTGDTRSLPRAKTPASSRVMGVGSGAESRRREEKKRSSERVG